MLFHFQGTLSTSFALRWGTFYIVKSYFPTEKGIGDFVSCSLILIWVIKRGIGWYLKMPLSPLKELKTILSVPFLIGLAALGIQIAFLCCCNVTTAIVNFSCFFFARLWLLYWRLFWPFRAFVHISCILFIVNDIFFALCL